VSATCNARSAVRLSKPTSTVSGSPVLPQNTCLRQPDLSAPVDVYADWIDACDAVAKEAAAGRSTERSTNRTGALPKPVDDDDGFIENDDLDAEGEYEG
jgi:transcription elongation factor Elf1